MHQLLCWLVLSQVDRVKLGIDEQQQEKMKYKIHCALHNGLTVEIKYFKRKNSFDHLNSHLLMQNGKKIILYFIFNP